MHTIASILSVTRRFFEGKGIDTARLDAELLLADVLGVGRVYLYTHNDRPLTTQECDVFREKVRRRGKYEPVAYILGHKEFYGRVFNVNPHVLIPRPETEHIVETVLQWLQVRGLGAVRVWDIGVGSGVLAVTLALECPEAEVVASDISVHALQVAQANAKHLQAEKRITWLEGSLLEPWDGVLCDVVVSNPPYVETGAVLDKDVHNYEPHTALFAGADGLDSVRVLCAQVRKVLKNPGLFVCEVGDKQASCVMDMLREAGFVSVWCVKDLAGIDRVVVGENT